MKIVPLFPMSVSIPFFVDWDFGERQWDILFYYFFLEKLEGEGWGYYYAIVAKVGGAKDIEAGAISFVRGMNGLHSHIPLSIGL